MSTNNTPHGFVEVSTTRGTMLIDRDDLKRAIAGNRDLASGSTKPRARRVTQDGGRRVPVHIVHSREPGAHYGGHRNPKHKGIIEEAERNIK